MRILGIVALCVALAGCGLMARKERQEQMAAAKAAMEQAFADCKAQWPEVSKQAVERNRCYSIAAQPTRQFNTYPDIFDKVWADRAVIAERLQAGKLTVAEATQQLTQTISDATAEEQRRNLANRAVSAQEAMAVAASGPTVCNRVGNTTICN
jgi:hypothetical protein